MSVLHDIVHLLSGVAGIALPRKASTAFAHLVGGGVVCLVLTVHGLVIDHDGAAHVVLVDEADNYLPAVLGVGMILLGIVSRTLWPGSNANRVAG